MKCENCGAELREGSVYCMVCGKPVQIVPDYNAFDDYLDNLVGEDKSSSIEKIHTIIKIRLNRHNSQ